jgi:hypothetical protein
LFDSECALSAIGGDRAGSWRSLRARVDVGASGARTLKTWRPVAGAPGCPEGIVAVGFETASGAPGCPEGIVAVDFETASGAPGGPEGIAAVGFETVAGAPGCPEAGSRSLLNKL